jgi:hypothetical protein
VPGSTNFPSSLDSHTGGNPFGFAEVGNLVSTRLSAATSNSDTTISVVSTTGFASRGIIVIDREVITYTGTTATTFTGCTRGAGGTTASSHLKNRSVSSVPVAANHNDLAAAIVAIETVLGAGITASFGVMRKIAEVTLASAAAQIDFTNIPQVYRHLLVMLYSRNDTAGANLFVRLSSDGTTFDSGANYDWELVSANSTTVTGFGALAQTSGLVGAHGAAAGVMSLSSIQFGEYANSSYQKAIVAQHNRKDGVDAAINLFSGADAVWWRNTAAIRGIRLFPGSGNFAAGSRATLYGLPA